MNFKKTISSKYSRKFNGDAKGAAIVTVDEMSLLIPFNKFGTFPDFCSGVARAPQTPRSREARAILKRTNGEENLAVAVTRWAMGPNNVLAGPENHRLRYWFVWVVYTLTNFGEIGVAYL